MSNSATRAGESEQPSAPAVVNPGDPFAYVHRHKSGNSKTYDVLIQPADRLLAYRDTLLEEIPLYTAASISAITADRDRLREALDGLVMVIGLTAIKHASHMPALQEAIDAARKALESQ